MASIWLSRELYGNITLVIWEYACLLGEIFETVLPVIRKYSERKLG